MFFEVVVWEFGESGCGGSEGGVERWPNGVTFGRSGGRSRSCTGSGSGSESPHKADAGLGNGGGCFICCFRLLVLRFEYSYKWIQNLNTALRIHVVCENYSCHSLV